MGQVCIAGDDAYLRGTILWRRACRDRSESQSTESKTPVLNSGARWLEPGFSRLKMSSPRLNFCRLKLKICSTEFLSTETEFLSTETEYLLD